jgi:septum formation protein
VLAADTTVALGNEVLNKPCDLAAARAMLRKLSGRTHTVYTGVCLWRRPAGPEISHCETSEVTFRALDDSVITQYFELVNPLDKAGAYGIQEGRELILEHYTGSLSNIMGLPVEWLAARLHEQSLIPSPVAPTIEDSRFRANSPPASAPGSGPA